MNVVHQINLRFTIYDWYKLESTYKSHWRRDERKIFKDRAKKLAIEILRLVDEMPRSISADELARQIVRAACRAKSTADMINKLKIVEEESDETAYWFELINEMGSFQQDKTSPLTKETNEILAMTVASLKTLRSRKS